MKIVVEEISPSATVGADDGNIKVNQTPTEVSENDPFEIKINFSDAKSVRVEFENIITDNVHLPFDDLEKINADLRRLSIYLSCMDGHEHPYVIHFKQQDASNSK
ncbi:hypothetical protein QQ008_14115 [Fulvivirgaceae bacterium BMA10]|uniref:Uncharacterized protein n=1 Tax=Splendidivirga corallicola TaxID=3051826 RepID=A0ABT8KSA6_9BACT|nr:hypothetical protein [Fulvivirgaceae bacterium BMA10]